MAGQWAPTVGAGHVQVPDQVPPLSTADMPVAMPLDPATASGDAHVYVVIDVPGRLCTNLAAADSTAICDPLATLKIPAATLPQSSSSSSTASSTANSAGESPECRICLSAGDAGDLVQPCSCSGSLSHTHTACLSAWVQERGSLVCELCGKHYKEPHAQQLAPIAAAAAAIKMKNGRGTETVSQRPVRLACDIWSVACVLLAVLVAVVVFSVVTAMQVRRPPPRYPAGPRRLAV